jgi:hypothetical protein
MPWAETRYIPTPFEHYLPPTHPPPNRLPHRTTTEVPKRLGVQTGARRRALHARERSPKHGHPGLRAWKPTFDSGLAVIPAWASPTQGGY